jgi:hypothetical protein
VSVRERDALFCPECGKPLAPPAPAESALPATENKSDADGNFGIAAEPNPALSPSSDSVSEEPGSTPEARDDAESPRVYRPGDKTRERFHRASEVARGVTRGVIEEPARRVEKIRQASSVVFEEASYDPSLRFVLVALGLFVVFVVLLVLSKVMG